MMVSVKILVALILWAITNIMVLLCAANRYRNEMVREERVRKEMEEQAKAKAAQKPAPARELVLVYGERREDEEEAEKCEDVKRSL